MLSRAWATLDVKSLDDEQRLIEGLVTTPSPDRRGDIVEPTGAEFTLPMPLLWQHDVQRPVGEVLTAQVTPAGIAITAKFAQIDVAGTLRDRLDDAWHSVKARLVRGLSIGFKPLEARPVKRGDPYGAQHVTRWLWAETSAVTLPMNVQATITNIKAASGQALLTSPGATGRQDARMTPTYAEQITDYESRKSATVAQMAALMATDATLDAEQTKQYDGWSDQVKSLDAHLLRLRELEALNATRATPVVNPIKPQPVVSITSNLPPGCAFTRYAMAIVNGRGDSMRALEFAKQYRADTPVVELMVKAAVAPGDTLTPAWAGVLVQIRQATDEWLALLRPRTILGRISGLHQVPFNTQLVLQTGGGTYKWVGQGAPKPVGKLALTTVALQFSKAAGIIVITEELAKLSSPSAEVLVRDDMLKGMAQFLDTQFIDPAVALVANVSPASITNGAGTAASSDNALTDLATLLSYFSTNNIPLGNLHIILSENNAAMMGLKRDALGNPLFPGVSADGGSAAGFKLVPSNAAGTNVIGVQPDGILYADDGGVTIDVSREASLNMNDAPVAGDATTVFRSLWQDNLVALRAERMINWLRARPNFVYYLTDAVYTAA
jgi:HK97 family phage major capsid protein